MPEIWLDDRKKRFVYWDGKEINDDKQEILLKKVFELIGLDLPRAIEIKKK